jgi:hypothetical protein
MVDWAGHTGQPTQQRYRDMARDVRAVSPSYERICVGVASDSELIARLDTLPAPKRQPNLLLAAVRYLAGDAGRPSGDGAGPVGSYDAFRAFVLERWVAVSATMRARRTQTNEARRCATLLPALAAITGPIALLEVGASAGLCLYPDRYAYRYDAGAVLGASQLVLDCRTAGDVPLPGRLPDVAWRAGLDLNPLNVRVDDDVAWLRSLIWPEEVERFGILDRAVGIARAEPARIVRGDLLSDLGSVAADAPADATLVIFHSAVLAYLAEDQRLAFRAAIGRLAARRTTVWLSNEGPGVVAELPVPDGPVPSPPAAPFSAGGAPFVLARDGVPLATAGPHGDWIVWH